MNYKQFLFGFVIFLATQALAWYQTNGQFISSWAKSNPFIVALLGIPISLGYIYATQYSVQAFGGTLWPTRLVGFSAGILAFTFLTYYHLGETITLKTTVTLILASIILLIQILWKN